MSGGAAGSPPPPLTVFLVAGEESGDKLGAGLMAALKRRTGGQARFAGVGGSAMAGEGLASLFPMTDISLMGFAAVLKALPRVIARIRQTAAAIKAARPDALVIIDSPDFTHRVAAAARRADHTLPVIDYVSPSVWAWRQGRARKMRAYIDHVLALLPFEPALYARLGGPACTYVGHPLAQDIAVLRPDAAEQARRDSGPPSLLILPGSRRGEIARLLPDFLRTVGRLRAQHPALELVLPTLPHLEPDVRALVADAAFPLRVVTGTKERHAAMRSARAALAASGTVTLELALAGVPMVAAYRVVGWEAAIARRLIRVPTIVLANLVLGENVTPELLQEDCTPERLAAAVSPLLRESEERAAQLRAFARLDHIMEIGSSTPSERAAEIVLSLARGNRFQGETLVASGGTALS
ncbi:MAG: lipid-A-disaccharide synthase [Alphaproteobacteria bacterium]